MAFANANEDAGDFEHLTQQDEHETPPDEVPDDAAGRPVGFGAGGGEQGYAGAHQEEKPGRAGMSDQARQERERIAAVVGQRPSPELDGVILGDEPTRVVDRHQGDDQTAGRINRWQTQPTDFRELCNGLP